MIDFIKIRINDSRLPDRLLNSKELTFVPQRGKQVSNTYKNWVFNICDSGSIEFTGSLHKYFNDGIHNWNDFTRVDLWDTIHDLCSWLEIDPDDANLHNLEFGVNVVVPWPPKELIRDLIAYKGIPFERQTMPKNGSYQQARVTGYFVKCYDKGSQYLQDSHILRFEVKVTAMRYFKNVEIRTLGDLRKDAVLQELGKLLFESWNSILVRENFPADVLSPKEQNLWYDATNAQYLNSLVPKKRHSLRRKYEQLIDKYSLEPPYIVYRKKVVGDLIFYKWTELIKGNVCHELQPEQKVQETERLCHSDIVDNYSRDRVCKITKINIQQQKEGSVFVSEKTVKGLSVDELRGADNHRRNKRKHDLSEEYYLAHNIRNVDSNGRNNLRRKIERILQEPGLFDSAEVVKLTVEQKRLLDHWKGTRWEYLLEMLNFPSP